MTGYLMLLYLSHIILVGRDSSQNRQSPTIPKMIKLKTDLSNAGAGKSAAAVGTDDGAGVVELTAKFVMAVAMEASLLLIAGHCE